MSSLSEGNTMILQLYIQQIEAARKYSLRIIDSLPYDEYFVMPQPSITHVAWQMGHIAIAQYRLCLGMVRGPLQTDESIIPASYAKLFGRDTIPNADCSVYPKAQEIREVFDRVYQKVIAELSLMNDSILNDPILLPHTYLKTKGETISWSSHHEMIHHGQIALLRRLLGHASIF